MDEMMFDVQTTFLMELIAVLDEKYPTAQAEAMLKLANWYKAELEDVVRYVEEEAREQTFGTNGTLMMP